MGEINLHDLLVQGVHFLQGGALDEAAASFRQVRRLQPDNLDALHLLGVIRLHQGQAEDGIRLLERAVAIKPDFTDASVALGIGLRSVGRHADAVKCFRRALAGQPDHIAAHYNLGNALMALGRVDEAVASYRRVLDLDPGNAETHASLGLALQCQGQLDQAAASYRRALDIAPDVPETLNNLANVLLDLGRIEEAIASYRRVIELDPETGQAYADLGVALYRLGRFDEAVASYRRALDLVPGMPETLKDLGNALRGLGELDEAAASYRQALDTAPNDAVAHYNLGVVLLERESVEAAIASFRTALALDPALAVAECNLGSALMDLGRIDEALTCYGRAIALDPDDPEGYWNEALAHLTAGDFARGWPKYEWRWEIARSTDTRRVFAPPLWLGAEDVAGKTVLLHAEQGFGDTLQFVRFVRMVAERGARIVLEVQPALRRLLAATPGAAEVIARGDPLPEFYLHCPLMSLPLALGITLDSIPNETPYIQIDAALQRDWQARLGARRGLRVGLAWTGKIKQQGVGRNRIPFETIRPLTEIAGIEILSLQKDVPPDDLAALEASPTVARLGETLGDFADTAALIAALDLVITIDTSVAHLAAALGKPVWLLLHASPDWRWLTKRTDSPWYPTVRLYRQESFGDWAGVVARMAQALTAFQRLS